MLKTMTTTTAPAVPQAPEPGCPPQRPRFWSEADCQEILRRLQRVTTGGGITTLSVWSTWSGHVRWARNRISTAGETRDNLVRVDRDLYGAKSGFVFTNDVSDAGLEAAARYAERAAQMLPELPAADPGMATKFPTPLEPLTGIPLFSDATYQLDADRRAAAAERLAQLAADRGLLSAGYVQVSARAVAMLDTLGHLRYVSYTQAQCSVTVRDPGGTGSGWAGDSHWDWAKLDPDRLTQVALEKCVKSQHPVRVEPGRYTAILEPQAVADFVAPLVSSRALGRLESEYDLLQGGMGPSPFHKLDAVYLSRTAPGRPSTTRLGERVVDARLSLGTDPTDPELGYPPFGWTPLGGVAEIDAYHPATWIRDGVLVALAYDRWYGALSFGQGTGLPNPGGFRLSVTGPTQTVDEMVAGTKRGLLVTRFDQVQLLHFQSLLVRGYTRDGLWLVEDGRITKAAKNLQFAETILGKLNSVEQVGAPVRAFHPPALDPGGFPQPVIVPAMKLADFSFTALADAV